MRFDDFWYVVAESHELSNNAVLGRKVLDAWLVCFRDKDGRARVLEDRCLHRNAQLSLGRIDKAGHLQCPYHGWCYDADGRVARVPSLGPDQEKLGNRQARTYDVIEQDDLVYVRLAEQPTVDQLPFAMPSYKAPGYHTIRLQNRFANTVTNCAENFVDIPHTAYVHSGIFRDEAGEPLEATVERKNGAVHVEYHGERANLGVFAWFLNPSGRPIEHRDNFHMPNVTSVEYVLQRGHFFITSQCIPTADDETLVYTDLTYNYGLWTRPAAWFVKRHGQNIIDQDLDILKNQMSVIDKYGEKFANTPADIIHVFIESIRNAIAAGDDPRDLPDKSQPIRFWV